MKQANLLDQPRPALSQRQLAVLERVAARRSLKAIAAQLGCSESAVNQHIKTLKGKLGANSLGELADVYRELNYKENEAADSDAATCRKSACMISQLSQASDQPHPDVNDERAESIVFSDALAFELRTPWETTREQSVVPGVLNGRSAGLVRTGVIVAMTFLLLASVVLAIAAGQTLSDLIR